MKKTLIERNIKMAEMLSLGYTRKEIADTYGVSLRYVEVIFDNLRKEHSAVHIAHLIAVLIKKELI